MEKLKIKSLVIEYRPRIQSGYCFIGINDSLENHQTKVSLKSSEIVIKLDDEVHTIATKNFFEINLKSFHSLLVKDTFISFRFIIGNGEQFDTEVLKLVDTSSKFQRIKISLESNKDEQHATITCSNCVSSLTVEKEVEIRRVRELPSSNLDVSEWFCHRHDDEKLFENDESSASCFDEKTQQFNPKLHDVFHGPFFLLMNSQHFDENRLRRKGRLIYCKRCLQLMGETNDKMTKFWCETVRFNDKPFFDVDSPINLIKLVIRNHLACDGLMVAPIVKIIFESAIHDNKKVYILIQVMDKNLQLLRFNFDESQLVKQHTVKLMYLKLDPSEIADDERTLKYWQKDLNIATFELSFKMFHTLCEYLKTQSQAIPDIYRTNNCFSLSYIELM